MRQIILMAVLAAIIGGCENNDMDIRKKYPDWPKWGWWDRPAKTDDVDETKQKKQEDEVAVGRPETLDDRTDVDAQEAKEGRPLTALPDAAMTKEKLAHRIELLESHREKVWRSVSMLREIDSLPLPEQNELRRKILENIDKWYEPMPVSPPNTKEQDWTDVVIWDFMPSPLFMQAVNRWQAIAQKKNLKFPENPNRRELLKYINDYVAGKLKPDKPEQQ